ncbi:septum formation initiator, partial [Ignavibacterium album]|uniref:septum formation initiator n=1 Tax=Ignavibacterium album TaxID=591197 RepID=UPI0038B34015
MKTILMFYLFCSLLNAQSEIKDTDIQSNQINILQKEIDNLKKENNKVSFQIKNLLVILVNMERTIDSLKYLVQSNREDILLNANQLGGKISMTEENANRRIEKVNQSLSTNTLYGIIIVLATIILSGLLFFVIRRKQQSDKIDIIDQLSSTKSSIEEGLVREFNNQTEILAERIRVITEFDPEIRSEYLSEPDHTLALRVASEINLIERNIKLMDAGTKGLKQLIRSVGKLKDNLTANGYEMPELLGKQFHQGMKLIVANSVPDENLDKGSEIITKVLIPQVNYKDKMI